MATNATCCDDKVFPMEGFCWDSLGLSGQLFAVVTLHIRAVATNLACLSTGKTLVIIGHHVDLEDVMVAITCCTVLNFSTSLMTCVMYSSAIGV